MQMVTKRAEVTILTPEKIDFKSKTKVTGDKEGHHIMIKGSSDQEYSNYKYVSPNIRGPKYMKETNISFSRRF